MVSIYHNPRVPDAAYRFWRYKILMRSADRDLHDMTSYRCLECSQMRIFNETSDDHFACEGCGWKCNFGGLIEMTDDDDYGSE